MDKRFEGSILTVETFFATGEMVALTPWLGGKYLVGVERETLNHEIYFVHGFIPATALAPVLFPSEPQATAP